MMKKKYLSGSEKRKLKKQRDESVKKLPTVTAYFKSSIEQTEENSENDDSMDKNDAIYTPNSIRTGIFNNIENFIYSIECFRYDR